MRVLLLGATGLVGRHVLERALADPRVTEVTAPGRRTLPPHPKLRAPLVDFEALPEAASWWQADAALCAFGTTMRVAGSEEAFRRIDHGYPLAAARLARAHGTPCFVLNSALGANPASRFFYPRVKGELEHDIERLGFPSLTLVRPGLIGGQRAQPRLGEQIAALVFGALDPILPASLRIAPADTIARVMLDSARAALPGCHVASLHGEKRTPAGRTRP
ncbi:NAD-dependent dehydratase [Methylobacterium organophilum]|uniref:NAD-dependent dehydratase n=1 Tax=Methylobacterium organophilum TaxID=410 RepID=A0ABQ4TBC0_METOR|nr:NAD-dependent dehydratase [Methylobacterium organophilum]GJE28160.1 hypothetical protein LKMONMHP_3027 [Methylobacterium organophilum]